jgi:hypothetical protein
VLKPYSSRRQAPRASGGRASSPEAAGGRPACVWGGGRTHLQHGADRSLWRQALRTARVGRLDRHFGLRVPHGCRAYGVSTARRQSEVAVLAPRLPRGRPREWVSTVETLLPGNHPPNPVGHASVRGVIPRLPLASAPRPAGEAGAERGWPDLIRAPVGCGRTCCLDRAGRRILGPPYRSAGSPGALCSRVESNRAASAAEPWSAGPPVPPVSRRPRSRRQPSAALRGLAAGQNRAGQAEPPRRRPGSRSRAAGSLQQPRVPPPPRPKSVGVAGTEIVRASARNSGSPAAHTGSSPLHGPCRARWCPMDGARPPAGR